MSDCKELIGYSTFCTQEQFEDFQINNPNFIICSVIPQLMELNIETWQFRKQEGLDGNPTWGIFVTYRYSKGETND